MPATEQKPQPVDVDASHIPLIKRQTPKTEYSFTDSEIRLTHPKQANQILAENFKLFGISFDDYRGINDRHFLYLMQEALPEELQDACVVLEHLGKSGLTKISLFFEPSRVAEVIAFFNEHLPDMTQLNFKQKLIIDTYLGKLDQHLEAKVPESPRNQELMTAAQRVMSKIWQVLGQELDKPAAQIETVDETRATIHEAIHYATQQNQWQGLINEVIYNGFQIAQWLDLNHTKQFNQNPESSPDQLKKIKRLVKIKNLITAVRESEAIIHETLGSLVLTNTEHYSHWIFCARLLTLLRKYEATPDGQKLKINHILLTQRVIMPDGQSKFLEHDTGTLFLIFGDRLNIDALLDDLNFSQFWANGAGDLRAKILERIEQLVDYPDKTAKFLLNNYDFIQDLEKALIQRFNSEFADLFDQYPTLVNDFGSDEWQKYADYTAFLRDHPEIENSPPLQVQPQTDIAVERQPAVSNKRQFFPSLKKIWSGK